MKKLTLLLLMLVAVFSTNAQGYKVGDKATDFSLRNVDGIMVSMADYDEAKGFIVIFTCNHCPYSIAYEDRIIALDNKFAGQGYPVIAINPNDSVVQPMDSYSKMKVRATEKVFPFPYLLDADQSVFPTYGATRTPHVYILQKENGELVVRYIGAIDDNHEEPTQVTEKYVDNAVETLLEGKLPEKTFTKAIGCTIKVKK